MNKFRILLVGLIGLYSYPADLYSIPEIKSDWPRTIKGEKGELTMYQPQPESLDGTFLSGRAAISVKLTGSDKPVFGAIWITSTLLNDRDTRIASLTEIKISNIRFADEVDADNLNKLKSIIEEEMKKWDLKVSIDELVATLEADGVKEDKALRNDPPEIIISNVPAILVFIDGDPVLTDLSGYSFKRISNTPYFLVFDDRNKSFYLLGSKKWFSASDLKGKWTYLQNPSQELRRLQTDIETAEKGNGKDEETPSEIKSKDVIPSVIIRTSPAELIVIDGEPDFKPIKGTDLLYVTNSENYIFMDIKSQSYFILISGRWYAAKDLKGPWSFVEADKIPDQFAKIPEGSEMDGVLASVPGTDAARDAVLDNQIPQTAEVNRKSATVTVEYDGEPEFENVNGTTMQYAVNSPQTVLKVSTKYYCVENGIWFEAGNPKGPWSVATERPGEVEKIEPSSPVYNVRYVYIYDVTPDVVYVGYTPGYYGCYVYGPTVVYGTGFYYRPWYGRVYYPRPVTYGFRMTYNPWTGWGIRMGISYGGWFHMSFGTGFHGGFWGPPVYRPPYYWHNHHGGFYGGRPRPTLYSRPNNNIYARDNRRGVTPTITQLPATGTNRTRDVNTVRRDNNVYTDKSGNVYQKTDKGWNTRENSSWKPVENNGASADRTRPGTGAQAGRPATGAVNNRPSTGAINRPSAGAVNRPSTGAVNRPSTGAVNQSPFNRSALDRASQDRARSQVRTNNFNRSIGRSPTAPSRSSSSGSRSPSIRR